MNKLMEESIPSIKYHDIPRSLIFYNSENLNLPWEDIKWLISGVGFTYYAIFTHHVLKVNEWVIDGHNLHLLGDNGGTGHQTADTTESERGTVYLVWPLGGGMTPWKPDCRH